MSEELFRIIKSDTELVNKYLHDHLSIKDSDYPNLFDSVLYSVEAGGKRVRPFLVLEFCRMFGGDAERALPFACAVEMIHTYSLIHDDLPCMDNDDLRRGKPTNHIVFGQSTALLAGDALLTGAFDSLCDYDDADIIAIAVRVLSRRAGILGMIGGQQIDILHEDRPCDLDTLTKMHSLKTGALISAACELGVLAAGVSDDASLGCAREYAHGLGLAFQIEDDILDAYGDEAVLGKPIGSDAENGKTTFLTVYGAEKARELAVEATERAKNAISGLDNSGVLCDFADMLLSRKK